MPYKTHPYVPLTLFVPNLATSYTVENNRLTSRRLGIVFDEVSLPPASAKRKRGIAQALLHGLLDRGDVIVTDHSGASHSCNRIRGVSAFRAALNGVHPDVKENPAEDPDAWKSDLVFLPFVVAVPKVPEPLYEVLGHAPLIWSIKEGDVLKKGAELARFTGHAIKAKYPSEQMLKQKEKYYYPRIKMPLNGRVLRTVKDSVSCPLLVSSREEALEQRENPEKLQINQNSADILLEIQPALPRADYDRLVAQGLDGVSIAYYACYNWATVFFELHCYIDEKLGVDRGEFHEGISYWDKRHPQHEIALSLGMICNADNHMGIRRAEGGKFVGRFNIEKYFKGDSPEASAPYPENQ